MTYQRGDELTIDGVYEREGLWHELLRLIGVRREPRSLKRFVIISGPLVTYERTTSGT